MNSKEIFIKIDKIIRSKYRFTKTFCEKTGRSANGFNNSYKRALKGGGSNLDNVEKILNDLDCELTINKRKKNKTNEI